MEKCIACGLCAEKCPKKVPSAYDQGLAPRKAAYVQYAQAVPLKYAIDPEHCIFLTRGKCRVCEKFCPTGAVNFDDRAQARTLRVGALVLTQGTEIYDPGTHDTFGYRRYPNVVTSLEFERILAASGPYGGHLVRPSDRREPRKIAWLQCVGSRDEHIGAKGYCSAVCCTYAVKEAMLAKEHARGQLDAAVFFIDIRTHGKDFERYYNRAKDDLGVRFIKSRVIGLPPVADTGGHLIRYVDEAGRRQEEEFDMVVLSAGLGVGGQGRALAETMGVALDRYGFAATGGFAPVQSSRPGIYVCGAFQGPKDIPSSVIDASAAAGVAGSHLGEVRWTLTRTKSVPPEIDIRGQAPRVGVFVCCCGTNIAGIVDVPAVVEFARSLPGVVYAEQNMFSCAQDTQGKMAQIVREKELNRVVVAACTPKTHEPLFQETLANAGLNKYLFEMANIRNQCSWVHQADTAAATAKAKDLVKMAVVKAIRLSPLVEPELQINHSALVIGGGVAGMTAARTLSAQGYPVLLVEKSGALGGQARSLHETWRGENVPQLLTGLIAAVDGDERIEVLLNACIQRVEGFVGNFQTTVDQNGASRTLAHGVTIIAAGATELKERHYLYGEDPRVVTGLELQERFARDDPELARLQTAVFLQCAGSRIPERPYCSKVCCTQSIKSALELKRRNPAVQVYVVYRDMRPYGLREALYRRAREAGVAFIRYDFARKFAVERRGPALEVAFTDTVLRRRMVLRPDLLVLASAVVAATDNPLARFYKVSQNEDGFFAEAHVKLRPVDFATDGVFVCGLAHGPKPLDEAIPQAQAAAARAVTLLSTQTITVSGTVACVTPRDCSSCGVCVAICPYGAPTFNAKTGKAEIQATLCKGCGLCVASCRSGAIQLNGFEMPQIMAMLDAAV
jgi:heterodisulfide reductase subunit A